MPVQTTNSGAIAFSANDQTWIIAEGVIVSSDVDNAAQSAFNNSILINYGSLLSSLAGAAGGVFTGTNATVHNEEGGIITGAGGLVFTNLVDSVRNRGTITAFGDHGISFQGGAGDVDVDNSGYIYGPLSGITVSAGSATDVTIFNSGLIESPITGIQLLNATATVSIENTGTIRGGDGTGLNDAAIYAASGDAIFLVNKGTVDGAITCNNGVADTILNSGVITGQIRLLGGDDFYDGDGSLAAVNVFGGADNDSLFGGIAGDILRGEAGNDSLSGQGLGTILAGGPGDDIYTPKDSNVTLNELGFGGSGTDTVQATFTYSLSNPNIVGAIENLTVFGSGVNGTGNQLNNVITASDALGAGANTLSGLSGNDTIDGAGGNDILVGGLGLDTLTGGGGNDTLIGGFGLDTLTGGSERDFFDFNSIAEAGKGAARDVITDLNRAADDRIDLRTIDAKTGVAGNNAFKFIGTKAFTDTKGELRCKSGIVQGDVNGDGKADFEIKVNLATLVKDDFFL